MCVCVCMCVYCEYLELSHRHGLVVAMPIQQFKAVRGSTC